MPKIYILREACKGIDECGICLFVCPAQVLTGSERMNEAGYMPPRVQDEHCCTGCLNCMLFCPDFAIVVEKEEAGSVEREEPCDG